MAKQGNVESRPPRRIARQGLRGRGAHLPASLRGAGYRRGVDPQQEQRHAGFLGGKRQAAACGEVQFGHPPPAVHDHRFQCPAPQGIDSDAQQHQPVGNDADQRIAHATAQFAPAIRLENARLRHDALRSQPQYRSVDPFLERQSRGKADHRRRVFRSCGIKLMHASPRQPAAKNLVQCRDAKGASRQWPGQDAIAGEGRHESHMFSLCSNQGFNQEAPHIVNGHFGHWTNVMGHSGLDPAEHKRRPWTASKNVGPSDRSSPRHLGDPLPPNSRRSANLCQMRSFSGFREAKTPAGKSFDQVHGGAGVLTELDRGEHPFARHREWQQQLILQVRPGKGL